MYINFNSRFGYLCKHRFNRKKMEICKMNMNAMKVLKYQTAPSQLEDCSHQWKSWPKKSDLTLKVLFDPLVVTISEFFDHVCWSFAPASYHSPVLFWSLRRFKDSEGNKGQTKKGDSFPTQQKLSKSLLDSEKCFSPSNPKKRTQKIWTS